MCLVRSTKYRVPDSSGIVLPPREYRPVRLASLRCLATLRYPNRPGSRTGPEFDLDRSTPGREERNGARRKKRGNAELSTTAGAKRGASIQSPQATWDFALSEPAWIADQSRNSTWIDLTQRREGAQGRKEERKRRHQASLGWYLTQKAPGTKIQSGDKLPHSTMQKLAPWRYPTVPDGRSQGPPGVRTRPRRIRPSRGCWVA